MSEERTRRVLIVEDSEDIRSSMAELLESEGYHVLQAPNGRIALAQLAEYEHLPGLILLDLMMPVMDGYEFRKTQKADPRLENIPVLLMTARGELDEHASSLAVEGYLRKPFPDIEAILEIIGRFFP